MDTVIKFCKEGVSHSLSKLKIFLINDTAFSGPDICVRYFYIVLYYHHLAYHGSFLYLFSMLYLTKVNITIERTDRVNTTGYGCHFLSILL